MPGLPYKPPVVLGNLRGPEGNAFCILGRCQAAAKKAGWSKEAIEKFMEKAKSGDYENLLRTVQEHFEEVSEPRPESISEFLGDDQEDQYPL